MLINLRSPATQKGLSGALTPVVWHGLCSAWFVRHHEPQKGTPLQQSLTLRQPPVFYFISGAAKRAHTHTHSYAQACATMCMSQGALRTRMGYRQHQMLQRCMCPAGFGRPAAACSPAHRQPRSRSCLLTYMPTQHK